MCVSPQQIVIYETIFDSWLDICTGHRCVDTWKIISYYLYFPNKRKMI